MLPIMSILISILFCLNMDFFDSEPIGQIIYTLGITFLMTNIPTAVLLAIYFSCRSKLKA